MRGNPLPRLRSLLHLLQQANVRDEALSGTEACVEEGLEGVAVLFLREQQQKDQLPGGFAHHTGKGGKNFARGNIITNTHSLPSRSLFCQLEFKPAQVAVNIQSCEESSKIRGKIDYEATSQDSRCQLTKEGANSKSQLHHFDCEFRILSLLFRHRSLSRELLSETSDLGECNLFQVCQFCVPCILKTKWRKPYISKNHRVK
jgi:hypothetical protein